MLRIVVVFFLLISLKSGFSQISEGCRPDQYIIQLNPASSEKDLKFSALSDYRCIHRGAGVYLLQFDLSIQNSQTIQRQLSGSSSVHQYMKNCQMTTRSTEPNDEFFGEQWSLDTTKATEFWDVAQGRITPRGDTIVVAIMDNGYDLQQEDLVDNIWKNKGEIPNDGIDNDNNGYIDDYVGVNVLKGNDEHQFWSHGTAVAGIIGATGDNEIGVAGMTWGAQLMLLSEVNMMDRAIEGLYYIYEQRKLYNQSNGTKGAFVVATNYSQGYDQAKCEQFPLWDQAFDSLGTVGVLAVGATANQNWDIDVVGDVPTSCSSDYLLSVTHTTKSDRLDVKAGFGKTTIDLGAPGTNNLTCFPDNDYKNFTGTSSSAPHVAGAIALLYSAPCENFQSTIKSDPSVAALSVKSSIVNGAAAQSSLQGRTVSGGRLDVWKAYEELATTYGTFNSSFEIAKIFPNPSNGVFEIELTLPEPSLYKIDVMDSSGRRILEDEIDGYCLEGNFTMDLSAYKAGFYIVRIFSGSIVQVRSIIIL